MTGVKLDNKLYFFLIIISIIGGLWFQPLMIVAFTLCAIFILEKTIDESFSLIFFILPFALIFKFRGYDLSFLTILQILIIAVYLIKEKGMNVKLLMPTLILMCYFSLRVGSYYMAIVKLLTTCLFVCVFIENSKKNKDSPFLNITKALILGLIISSIIGMLKPSLEVLSSYYSDMNYQYIGGHRTLRFSGLFNDPNYYSIALIASLLSLSFLKWYAKISVKYFWWNYIILSALGFFTFSKSFILMFALCLVLELFLSYKSQKKIVAFFEVLLAGGLLVLFFCSDIDVFSKMLSRFGAGQELTTTRSIIWENYLSEIRQSTKSIIIGNTLGAPYVGGRAAHNLYIELLYYSGIIGTILYVFYWVYLIFFGHRKVKNKFLFVLPVSIFAMYCFLSGFLNYAFPFYIILSWSCLKLGEGDE